MYAIVDVAGQQFKVEKDSKVFVHRLDAKEGESIELDKVLLIDNEKNVTVGSPVISGALVKAKILEHLKGDKVIVFKKKRRKGYKKKNGHRQALTQLMIEDIIEKGAKSSAKKAQAPKAEKTEKAEVKTSEKPEVKKAAPKKAAPKAEETKAKATTKKAESAAEKTKTEKPEAKKTSGEAAKNEE